MRADPEQRAVQLAEYIVEQGATVRAAAAAFGCSKSTVHKDVSVRLVRVSPGLSAQVQAVLARNKAERHLRGGAATRRKYRKYKRSAPARRRMDGAGALLCSVPGPELIQGTFF